MKKVIIIEIVLFFALFVTSLFKSVLPFALNMIALIAVPIYAVVKMNIGNKTTETNRNQPIITEPIQEKPKQKWRYLWLMKEDQKLGNTFEKWYKEELIENTEYYRSNKDLREDYYEEKIYKFEPFELPFKIEENKVYSYMKEDEWVLVGTIKKNDQEAFKNALECKLYLMPNSYKYVGDNFVKAENNDTYFGLKILENQ